MRERGDESYSGGTILTPAQLIAGGFGFLVLYSNMVFIYARSARWPVALIHVVWSRESRVAHMHGVARCEMRPTVVALPCMVAASFEWLQHGAYCVRNRVVLYA